MVFIRKNRDFLWQTVSFQSFGCSMIFGEFQTFSVRQPCCRKNFCASWRRRCSVKLQRGFFLEKLAQGTGQQRGTWESGRPFPDRIGLRVLRHTDKAHAPTTPVLHSKTKLWPISEHVFWHWYTRWGNLVNLRVSANWNRGGLRAQHTWGLCVGRRITLLCIRISFKVPSMPRPRLRKRRECLTTCTAETKKWFLDAERHLCTRPFRRQWPTPRWNSMRHLRHFAFQMNIFHARWIRRLWGA